MRVSRQWWIGAAVIWTILIFVGTMLPASNLPEPESDGGFSLLDLPYLDKAVHFLMFFGFGALWTLASGTVSARTRVVIAGLGLAMLTELLQLIPAIGRYAGWDDIAADTLGLAFAWILAPKVAQVLAATNWIQPEHSPIASTG